MDTSHQFMIASLSKAFTAAAVLQLEEEGKVKLDDPLCNYLPEAEHMLGQKVTLYQLLTHSSGIPDYINDHPLLFKVRFLLHWKPERKRLLATILRDPLLFNPGEDVSYSNSGYVLLSQVVENASGQPFDEYVREHLLRPLGMKASGVGAFENLSHAAKGFGGNSFDKRPTRNLDASLTPGMGSVYSTSGDLFRWMRALMDTAVLSVENRTAMFTAHEAEYGFGWMVEEYGDSVVYHHSGYFPGWTSYICHFPQHDISFVCLSNYSQTDPWYLRDEFMHLWETNVLKPMEARPPQMKAQATDNGLEIPTQGKN